MVIPILGILRCAAEWQEADVDANDHVIEGQARETRQLSVGDLWLLVISGY